MQAYCYTGNALTSFLAKLTSTYLLPKYVLSFLSTISTWMGMRSNMYASPVVR